MTSLPWRVKVAIWLALFQCWREGSIKIRLRWNGLTFERVER